MGFEDSNKGKRKPEDATSPEIGTREVIVMADTNLVVVTETDDCVRYSKKATTHLCSVYSYFPTGRRLYPHG
jgi:hypothetical protein